MADEFSPMPELAMRLHLASVALQIRTISALVRSGLMGPDEVEGTLSHYEAAFRARDGLSDRQAEQLEQLWATLDGWLAPEFATLRREDARNREAGRDQ